MIIMYNVYNIYLYSTHCMYYSSASRLADCQLQYNQITVHVAPCQIIEALINIVVPANDGITMHVPLYPTCITSTIHVFTITKSNFNIKILKGSISKENRI